VFQLDLVNVSAKSLVQCHLVPFEQVNQEVFRCRSSSTECNDTNLYVFVELVYVAADCGHVLVESAELGTYDQGRRVAIQMAFVDDDAEKEDPQSFPTDCEIVAPELNGVLGLFGE
jgi:hypothetical protein